MTKPTQKQAKILFHYHPWSRAAGVRWLLEELGVSYDVNFVDPTAPGGVPEEYRAIHPHKKVPAIEIDGQIITERAYSGLVEIRVLNGAQEYSRTVAPLQASKNLEFGDLTEACIEVRARAINGSVSEPVQHCASFESRETLELPPDGDITVYVSCDSPQVQALLDAPDNEPSPDAGPPPQSDATTSGTAGSTSDASADTGTPTDAAKEPDASSDSARSQGCSVGALRPAKAPWSLALGPLVFWRRRSRSVGFP